ncbi:MAG: glycosyltransferase [Dechloromonas sp.]|nr:MAG: glycosyltransferase [Dechloromonas sp.]
MIPDEEKNVKDILILSFSVIRSDPRVMRQIRLLERDYRLTVSGYGPKPDAEIDFLEIDRPLVSRVQKGVWGFKLLLRLFESYYWALPQVRQGLGMLAGRRNFDLLIANDMAALPLALRIAAERPVLVDAHEYSPREFEDKLLWRILFAPFYDTFCTRYLPRAAAMTTVCEGIADEYAKDYGVVSKVVYNAPSEQLLEPSPSLPGRVRLIHHGSAIRSRHLGVMIEMMRYLDERFTLDFMLVETDPVSWRNCAKWQGKTRGWALSIRSRCRKSVAASTSTMWVSICCRPSISTTNTRCRTSSSSSFRRGWRLRPARPRKWRALSRSIHWGWLLIRSNPEPWPRRSNTLRMTRLRDTSVPRVGPPGN